MTYKNTDQRLKNHYDALAGNYETRWRDFLTTVRQQVMTYAAQTPPANILDFGCGTGIMLQMLGARYPDAALAGIDLCPAMRQIAQQNAPNATIKEKAGNTTERYDLVLSLNVLHHMNDAQNHLSFLREKCADNGRIILCDFAIDTLPMKMAEYLYWRPFHPVHNRAYSSKMLQKTIAQNGLHITDHTILHPDRFWRLQIYSLSPS